MINYHPQSMIVTALSVSIALEGVAISVENPCWPQLQVKSLCVRSVAALPHTEFPEQAPIVPSLSTPAVTVSTGSTQGPIYLQPNRDV